MISQITPADSQTGKPGQVDRAFGLPGAFQHTTFVCAERKDMPGPGQISGSGLRIDGGHNRDGAVFRGDARRDTFARVD